jgi:hypothetical protein
LGREKRKVGKWFYENIQTIHHWSRTTP